MIDYKLEYLFSYSGRVDDPEMIGPVAEQIRVNFYSKSGEISGPKMQGKIRPVGGDWFTVRKDGIGQLNVRTTFETDDGALILVFYQGVIDFGEDGYNRFLNSDLPPEVNIRTSPRFLTTHPDYLWLNRLHCLGVGQYRVAANEAKYDVYAVR
jgi:Protein of unknown function (DUF3237)